MAANRGEADALNELNQRIHADTVSLLYRQLMDSQVASLLIAFVVVLMFWHAMDQAFLMFWLSVIAVTALLRLSFRLWYQRHSEAQNRPFMWGAIFILGSIASGLAWGIGGLSLVQCDSLPLQVFIIFVIGGMAASAIPTEGQYLPAYMGFVFPLVLPSAFWLFDQNDPLYWPMGLLLIMYSFTLLLAAYRLNNIIRQSLELNREKEELIRNLNTEKEIEASLNVQLKQEIDAHNRTLRELKHLAHYDALTDLPNRSLFMELLNQALELSRRHQGRLALLFLDLDGFKNVNDTAGHEAGDKVLEMVAGRLQASVRASDTVARFAGDEFAIIINDLHDIADASMVAGKVNENLARPLEVGGAEFVVGASIGISIFPDDSDDAASLLKQADVAMYRVKHHGKSGYCFFDEELV